MNSVVKSIDYIGLLPKILRDYGREIHNITKADTGMIAYSLIGALSSAGCDLANERRYISTDGDCVTGPIGVSLIVIAPSGSLKSTVKNFAYQPIEDNINRQIPDYNRALSRYNTAMRLRKTKESLFDDGFEPQEPITPSFMQSNVTIEAVINLYGKGMVNMAIVSDEGGSFVGSRAMSRDSYVNTLSAFNTLLSGDVYTKATIKGGETLLSSKRLTFMLYLQPQMFSEFITRSGGISDAGFMQRTMVLNAKPAKTDTSDGFLDSIVSSFYENLTPNSIYNDESFLKYKQLMEKLLVKKKTVDCYGLLTPPVIEPSIEAKILWITFYVEQKKLIKESREEEDNLCSFRERAPETASRIATLFQLAENEGEASVNVTGENMSNAIIIVKQALVEQFRVYEVHDDFFKNIDILLGWYCRRTDKNLCTRMSFRKLIQTVPNKLRKKDILLPVLNHLIEESVIEFDSIEYIYNGDKKSKRYLTM